MKKIIFALVMLLVIIPLSVNAEECTDDIVASYLPRANNVSMQYTATSNPDTYKIYVYGLSPGISYDGINGTEFNDGYYAYASAGDTFTITIKISDGSECALRTIKTLSISIPTNTTVIEPVVEPTVPAINNESDNNTGSSPVTTPSTNTNLEPTSSLDNEETKNLETSINTETSDVSADSSIKDDNSSENNEAKINAIEDNKEELTSKYSLQKNNNLVNKYILISMTILMVSGIGIYIYFKKFKGTKK